MNVIRKEINKGSIRYKLVIISTILISFTVFLCWVVNKTFLIEYYELSKTEILGSTYDEVNDLYNQEGSVGIGYEENSLILEKLTTNRNMNLYVFDIYYNLPNIFMKVSYPSTRYITNTQRDMLSERVNEYYTNDSGVSKEKTLLKSAPKYNIYRVFDNRLDSQYLELFGSLDNESTIYLRTNFESMQENVRVANKFLGFAGIFATLFGVVVMFFISRSYTKPILQLSEIAKKMSDLDFDVKYQGVSEDEIGVLGASINSLSTKLENTISELKSANNELEKDIQKKIKIDEIRKEFLSNVSHELKTPIALIQGYAEGLKENINEDLESKDYYCEVIIDEASKMNKMVKKLLALNQIEFGNNQLDITRFDILSMIKSIVSSTAILFRQKGVSLILEENEPIYVWADEYMLEEVMNNYISNALNHVSGEHIIKITITTKQNVVRVSVYNTGENIPEDELENVWIKFYKVDKARTREYGGSGIGLSIVKAIMESMNKECGVVNYKDGVEFWFEVERDNIKGN